MSNFFLAKEKFLVNKFNKNGFIIFDIKDYKKLNSIKKVIFKLSKKFFLKKKIKINKNFFNYTHKYVNPDLLNSFRMFIYSEINKNNLFLKDYYLIGRDFLNIICGNELVMQKSINLSIQMPKDKSSLLEMHADTWSGDSPYEIVLWLPLVDCFKTKSMYILPSDKYELFLKKFKSSYSKKNFDLFKSIKKDLIWLDIKFGEVLLFNQCLPHGNVVNKENETRWSMNCRFKSVFTPYGDKKIGEFFQPITLRASSRIGMKYELPDGKN